MNRRAFIAGFGSAVAWPVVARGQQGEPMRRIGVLLPATADDSVFQARVGVFQQELALLGWAIGRNVRIDIRWASADAGEIRRHAAELAALMPDVILATGDSTMPPLLQATHTIPIVFPVSTDPVANGYVANLARPGGNATGFMISDYSMGGKWVELLKEVAPGVRLAAVLRDTSNRSGIAQYSVIQAMAPSLRVEVNPLNMHDAQEIECDVAAFARSPNAGLIITASGVSIRYRELIITLAARYKLPAIYWASFFVGSGGLISYGADWLDQYRRAAGYVDRILKGEKPADMPVQAPTKYALAINLKTAKKLGLIMPASLLARADEVIE
jgi:putative ABC transport system substrate-binding protein